MTQEQKKYLLCTQHRSLLYIILHFGNGVMLLPQLRVFCLTLGLYANGQAVNRAVRELREADILNRQTWIDSNSDLVLCRKYVYCFFTGKAREEVATPRRPNTMAPYILQARKIDWLLLIMEKNHLTTLESVEKYLLAHGCTVFLRLPDLLAYYEQCAPILAQVYPSRFQEQTEQLRAGMEQRSRLARGEPIAPLPALSPEPVATLEKTHRRGLYISGIYPQQKTVCFALFAGREATAQKVMDWVIDAHSWVISLLPDYNTILYVYVLDANHEEALKSVLTAVAPKSEQTPYYRYRLEGRKFAGRVRLGIIDSHFVTRWCGGVCRTHSDRH